MNPQLTCTGLICVAILSCFLQLGAAQDSSANTSWTSSTQQTDTKGSINPTRTTEAHSESSGRVVDKTSVETLGPDGRYIPYSETEKESVRVDANTTRTVERTYARGPDGQRSLIQQSQTESRKLANGGNKMVRTSSSPDADGRLQPTRREEVDSRQVSPGVTQTNTTVLSPDANGGMSPVVRTEQKQEQTDGGRVEFSKSTLLSDGTGHWNLTEVREGTVKPESEGTNKEERVLRPDSNGHLAEVERTVSRQAGITAENRDTTETYSTNVPGVAGNDHLQLVGRETTIERIGAGRQGTVRQVEGLNPGNPDTGLQITQQAIDIVRPGVNGSAQQQSTTVTFDSEGRASTVWVQMGETNNPSAVQVETRPAPKAK